MRRRRWSSTRSSTPRRSPRSSSARCPDGSCGSGRSTSASAAPGPSYSDLPIERAIRTGAAASSRRSTAHTVCPTAPRCSSGSGVGRSSSRRRSRSRIAMGRPYSRFACPTWSRRRSATGSWTACPGGSTRSSARRPRGLPVAHRPAHRSHPRDSCGRTLLGRRSRSASACRRPRGRRPRERGVQDGSSFSGWKGGHHVSHINHHRGGRYTMNAPASITITPVFAADLLAEGERMPVYVHVIDHPDARVLVDTGMTELHPAVADLDPRLLPLSKQDFDLAGIDIVVNTHLHFDHCGGNHLFAGRPIYVQRRELDDARNEDDYTIREWVEAPGVRYVPVDGEFELLPGLRLVPAAGHTRGMQVVVVKTGGRPVVVGGDVAVWFGELDEPHTEGQLRVRALDPELVWLAHEHEPWRPRTV